MAAFQPNPLDIYALHVFRQVAAELERHCASVYLSDRNQLAALHNVLVQANDAIEAVKMNALPAQQCSVDSDCPPLHVCNGGECEVVFWPSPPPPPQRRPQGKQPLQRKPPRKRAKR